MPPRPRDGLNVGRALARLHLSHTAASGGAGESSEVAGEVWISQYVKVCIIAIERLILRYNTTSCAYACEKECI